MNWFFAPMTDSPSDESFYQRTLSLFLQTYHEANQPRDMALFVSVDSLAKKSGIYLTPIAGSLLMPALLKDGRNWGAFDHLEPDTPRLSFVAGDKDAERLLAFLKPEEPLTYGTV